MLGLGPAEFAIVAAIILLLFGPKRLPELARGIGKSIAEFRKGTGEGENSGQS